jgi:hypothetical protein
MPAPDSLPPGKQIVRTSLVDLQMTDAKSAAAIVSASTAGLVFLVAWYRRWEQLRRDREALLATLEQQFCEEVCSFACAHMTPEHVNMAIVGMFGGCTYMPAALHNAAVRGRHCFWWDAAGNHNRVCLIKFCGSQVDLACAYLQALRRKYPGTQLWDVLFAERRQSCSHSPMLPRMPSRLHPTRSRRTSSTS